MKKFLIAAAFAFTAVSAHAGTYNVEGYSIHVSEGCASSSCVSVYAPGYGYYHGGPSVRAHKAHKDNAKVATVVKKDDTTPAPAAATAPAPEATPAAAPAKAAEPAAQAAPAETPAK